MNADGLLFSAKPFLWLVLACLSSDLLQLQKGVSFWRQTVPKPLPASLLAISFPSCAFTRYKNFKQLLIEI